MGPATSTDAARYLTQLFGLEGQVAIVVGGTGVLGGALCDGLAQVGARVIVAGLSDERGAARVAAIQSLGGQAIFHSLDATSGDGMRDMRSAVLRDFGSVDVLINCAGINLAVPYEEITDEQWDRVMRTNLWATQLGCQTFAPVMASQSQGGSILNIGSVTAHIPLSRVFAYAASKAAVVNLTQNVAREYAQRGVRVNVLCPGFFPAEQNRAILDATRVDHIRRNTPMGRFGEPHELVGAALLLLSRNAASFITGSTLYVDGGFTSSRF